MIQVVILLRISELAATTSLGHGDWQRLFRHTQSDRFVSTLVHDEASRCLLKRLNTVLVQPVNLGLKLLIL